MNRVLKTTLSGAFIFALSAISAAYAADNKTSGKEWPSFKQVDADNNGAVSMEEARSVSGLESNFSQYDKNSDGQLSRSEYESAKSAAKKSSKSSGSSGQSSSGSSSGGMSGSSGSGSSGAAGSGSSGSGSSSSSGSPTR